MDIQRLKHDIKELAAQLKALKTQLRTTWTRPMGSEQYEAIRLKAEVTDLLILRAHLRGRCHLADEERCREVAEGIIDNYRLEDEQAA